MFLAGEVAENVNPGRAPLDVSEGEMIGFVMLGLGALLWWISDD